MITTYKSKSRGTEKKTSKRTQRKTSKAPNSKKTNKAPSTRKKVLFEKDNLRVVVVGGAEEVGRNMTMIEYNDDIIIIDMGLQFPEEGMPGIDYIIPNITYLEEKIDKVKGVVITHGHYDHIGGIPHIMGKIGNPPMYTAKLTAGLVRKRSEEFKTCPELKISEIDETSKVKIGKSFHVEFLRVNHSIPDSFAVIVHTPVGTLLHTGDFKIDYSPVNDKPADLNRIALLGDKGVMMMMSDSTDATHPGYQISESAIGDEIDNLIEDISGRIIVGTFASQLSRLQKLFDLAAKHGRRINLQGRSISTNVDIAHKIGYLKFNPKILVNDKEVNKLPDNKVLILGTGAQGENNAFLIRVVTGEHRTIRMKKGDTVIFSSSVVPGNERSIQALKDQVVRQGVKIIHYQMMDVHAGGHAKAEDLKLMMRLIKPKFFVPIEGNHYMLRAHAELAMQVGIPEENIFIPDNGQVISIKKKGREAVGKLMNEKIPSDYVMVDGLGVGDVSNIVLRDRKVMAEDGMIVIIATIDSKSSTTIGNPDIISRGFVYMKENRKLIEETRMKVKKIVNDHEIKSPTDDDHIKNKIRNEIGRYLFSQTKRRPMVLPVVIKV